MVGGVAVAGGTAVTLATGWAVAVGRTASVLAIARLVVGAALVVVGLTVVEVEAVVFEALVVVTFEVGVDASLHACNTPPTKSNKISQLFFLTAELTRPRPDISLLLKKLNSVIKAKP